MIKHFLLFLLKKVRIGIREEASCCCLQFLVLKILVRDNMSLTKRALIALIVNRCTFL